MIKMYFFPETSNWRNVQNFSNEGSWRYILFLFFINTSSIVILYPQSMHIIFIFLGGLKHSFPTLQEVSNVSVGETYLSSNK